MPRYTKFKTVIDGAEHIYPSEGKAYEALRDWAAQQPEGARAKVYVQEKRGEQWYLFERHVVRGGFLHES